MDESQKRTSIQSCLTDWWQEQTYVAGYPICRALSRLTNSFFEGPWAETAFRSGWSAEDIFGMSMEPTGLADRDEFSEGMVAGLIPMMAVGALSPVILGIQGDLARVMLPPGPAAQLGHSCVVIDRAFLGGRRVVWWRHSLWACKAPVGMLLH
jgi:hypothetical protein